MFCGLRARERRRGKKYSFPESLRRHLKAQLDRGVCALCGYPMHLDRRDLHLSPSADKVDPRKRYTVKNTQVVHHECNRIKGELPQRLIQPHIRRIMAKVYGLLSKSKADRFGDCVTRTRSFKEGLEEKAQGG